MRSEMSQRFTYEIDGTASLSDIAQSLLSIERITREVGPILEGSVRGLSIEKIEISLRELTHASPVKEIFWLAVFVAFQKDLEAEVPTAIEQLTGLPISESYDSIVTVVTLIIIFYGVDWVLQKMSPTGPSQKVLRIFNGLVDDAAIALNVPRESIIGTLEDRYGGNKARAIAKPAINFWNIAKRRPGSKVIAGSHEVGSDVISEIPSDLEVASYEAEEISEPFEDVEIELHAQDRDRLKQGWAGIINSVSRDRLRMTLYPPIQPDDIYRQDTIRGDVIVVSKRQDTGEYRPYMFHLVRLRR